jgi:hypothetical protein
LAIINNKIWKNNMLIINWQLEYVGGNYAYTHTDDPLLSIYQLPLKASLTGMHTACLRF